MQGILPYFTDPAVNSSAAGWFGHSFGGMLTAMAAGYVLEPDSKLLTKLMGIGNALCMPNFVMAAMDSGGAFDQKFPGTGINIWVLQIPIHAALTAATLMTAFGGSKGKISPPSPPRPIKSCFPSSGPATPRLDLCAMAGDYLCRV
jgi:hypothetical protein